MDTYSNTLFMSYGSVDVSLRYGDLYILTRDMPKAAPALAATQIVAPTLSPAAPEPVEVPPLSPRQREVLRLLVQGQSNKEIARNLGIAMGTVKIHTAILFSKMGVTGRTAAAVAGAKLLAPQDRLSTRRSDEGVKGIGTYPFGLGRHDMAA